MLHFNHFDFLAPVYECYIKPTDPAQFIKLARLPIEGLLLDAGGGTGRVSSVLKNYVHNIVIADSSVGMLSQAVKKGGFCYACTNCEEMPFKSESFERIIMVDALHHVLDWKLTLKEIWRVLKPAGTIVIQEPDIHTLPVKLMAILEKLALMRSHFIAPKHVAAAFNYLNAETYIEREGTTAWIVVNKLNNLEN